MLGELFLMGGLIVLGYVFWQPWYTTTVVATQQLEVSAEHARTFRTEGVENSAASSWDGVTVPVIAKPAANEVFGVMYVPAFRENYANVLAEGLATRAVLNAGDRGIGRYEATQLLGEPGNIALAAHRSGPFTTPFQGIMNLRVNDPIYIETAEGWYTYRFRTLEYVLPHEMDVLLPFPRLVGVPGEDRILTLTTCHPENWSIAERAVAYSVFESFRPAAEGPPEELLAVNPAVAEV